MENIESEAAQWVVRLDAPTCTQKDRDTFAAWHAASPQNKIAYTRISEPWQISSALQRIRPLDGSANPDLLTEFAQGLATRETHTHGKTALSHSAQVLKHLKRMLLRLGLFL